MIGFSCYIWNIEETIKLVGILKQVMPEVKIVLGGPEVSYEPLYWMKREAGVDFVVNGDGKRPSTICCRRSGMNISTISYMVRLTARVKS